MSASRETRRAVIRVDASAAIGTGHVVRCETLASALAGRGWAVEVLAREMPDALAARMSRVADVVLVDGAERESDLVAAAARFQSRRVDLCVTDSYRIGVAWHEAARRWADHVVAIDDLAASALGADLILNQNLGVPGDAYQGLVPAGATILVGPRYALVRPQFAEARRTRPPRDGGIARVLVFLTGGADEHDLTRRAAEACVATGVQADVVIGAANPHAAELSTWVRGQPGITLHVNVDNMAELMARADVAVGAPSSASWERCAVGLPAILLILADNQVVVGGELNRLGAARTLGWHHEVGVQEIADALGQLRQDPSAVRAMARAAAGITDGKGTGRVVRAVERLVAQ